MIKIIDPHLHLFALKQGNYHWLAANKPPFWPDKALINKSFSESDLVLNFPLSLAGFVHIEAGFDNHQPWREISYLQQKCQLPFTAIASIDLTLDSVAFNQQLERLSHYTTFSGVRHILDEQASTLLHCEQVQENISRLNAFSSKHFKKKKNQVLIFEVQLPLEDNLGVNALFDVIANHKNIIFIINHAGFPIKNTESIAWKNWHTNLTALSFFENTAIKCSGWEMVDRQYNQQQGDIDHNLACCFTAFGEKRMMLASNFPLCLFTHTSYQTYWRDLLDTHFMQERSAKEKSALCYDNALHYYSIKT